jgi:hypothetical protein
MEAICASFGVWARAIEAIVNTEAANIGPSIFMV